MGLHKLSVRYDRTRLIFMLAIGHGTGASSLSLSLCYKALSDFYCQPIFTSSIKIIIIVTAHRISRVHFLWVAFFFWNATMRIGFVSDDVDDAVENVNVSCLISNDYWKCILLYGWLFGLFVLACQLEFTNWWFALGRRTGSLLRRANFQSLVIIPRYFNDVSTKRVRASEVNDCWPPFIPLIHNKRNCVR